MDTNVCNGTQLPACAVILGLVMVNCWCYLAWPEASGVPEDERLASGFDEFAGGGGQIAGLQDAGDLGEDPVQDPGVAVGARRWRHAGLPR